MKNLILAQRNFFQTHQTKDIVFRKKQLKKLYEVLKKHEQEIINAVYKDFQKSDFDVYTTEIASLYESIQYYLKNIAILAKPKRRKRNLKTILAKARTIEEPLGVSLIIGAWNYPILLTLSPLIAAIAAGNTVLLKPSELTVHSSAIVKKIINEHFPKEYIHVVEGGIPETTKLLEQRFDKIFYTGSGKVGQIVYEAAAKHLTPVTLELGGKSPTFVTQSANIKIAAKRIAWGKFLNAGQTCIAPDYILVDQSVHQEFIKELTEVIKKSNYHYNTRQYCQIINHRNFDRLTSLIDQEKVIIGGDFDKEKRHLSPTVMDKVSWEDKIMEEEIFGPILPIIIYSDFQKTLDFIQRKEKPLAAYLFSHETLEIESFKTKLSFGGGCINDIMMHITSENIPFGGVGQSGIGNYHGEFGFKTFSHTKALLHNTTWGEVPFKFAPYTDKKLNWLKRFLGK